jgi:hypothetical protein
MAITLDKFRAKLIIRILYARSSEEAERFIKVAIRAMQKKNVNGHIITRFVDRVMNQLSIHESSNTNPIQWNNIMAAIFSLQRMRESMNISLG